MRRRRVFDIIQIGVSGDKASRVFDAAVVVCIIINIILLISVTFDVPEHYIAFMHIAEAVTVVFFTVELLLRLWTADYLYGGRRAISGLRYLVSFNGVVEILSIASFYVPAVFPGGLVVFRLFRVARILRLFRANAYSDAISSVFMVIKRKRNSLLSSIFIVLIIMIMSSLLMYWFEHDAQPGVFKNAFSGMWWATNALLTVGYGDIYPVTLAGRIAGIAITFLGVGMVAIPTGIMSAGFMEHSSEKSKIKRRESETHFCPHCGKPVTESELLDMNSWHMKN